MVEVGVEVEVDVEVGDVGVDVVVGDVGVDVVVADVGVDVVEAAGDAGADWRPNCVPPVMRSSPLVVMM